MSGRKAPFQTGFNLIRHHVKEFTQMSTFHGVKYVSMDNLHYLEVQYAYFYETWHAIFCTNNAYLQALAFSQNSLWLVVLTGSILSAQKLIGESYLHYNENPTVITIQKNYKDWTYTFPAATLCFVDNLDAKRATHFIEKTWHVKPGPEDEELIEGMETEANDFFSNKTDRVESNSSSIGGTSGTIFRYYYIFLRRLVNQTYANMELFVNYANDHTITNLNVKDTVLKVIREYKTKSTFYTRDFNYTDFHQTPTEMGMCYVHGGKISDYTSLGHAPQRIRESFEPPTCEYASTLCYARTEGSPSEIRYYIHSPYELPDCSQAFFHVSARTERDVAFTSLETIVSSGIHKLKPSQRHCRFWLEPVHPGSRVYSFNLCRMRCRKDLSFKLCGCAPYFYTREERIPVCNVTGLACLSQFSQMLITLRSNDDEELPCDCPPQCENVRYNIDKEITRSWTFPIPYDIRFRWSLGKFSRIRLRRDVIYSFTDLVVSFGGIAAFFLGCSVLSFVEIMYFFSLRLIWLVRRKGSS